MCTNRTTAQIDYLINGYNVCIFKDPNSFNFSPLKNNDNCNFFKNSTELTRVLNKKNDNRVKINNNFFFINKKYKEWKKLLNEKK